MQPLGIQRPNHGGNLSWAAELAGCSPSLILDFSASINPLGPPSQAIAAIQANLAHLRAYPDPSYHDLRQAIAHVHHLSPDWVLPGNGSAELLTWAGRELAELDAVYLFVPAFGDYFRALRAFGASIQLHRMDQGYEQRSPQDRWTGASLSAFLDHLDDHAVDVSASGLLLNNPQNPSGCLFVAEDVRRCLDRFAWVLVDEAFMDFLPPEQQQSVIPGVQEYPNLVVLRSLTKFYSLPGLRIGYAVLHPDRGARWQQWRDPWSVNALAAAASISALADVEFQQQTWDWLPAARSQLSAGLSALGGFIPYPSVANYILVQAPRGVPELQQRLLQSHRILIRDCLSFPELGDRFFRLAVRTPPEHDRLLAALRDSLAPVA